MCKVDGCNTLNLPSLPSCKKRYKVDRPIGWIIYAQALVAGYISVNNHRVKRINFTHSLKSPLLTHWPYIPVCLRQSLLKPVYPGIIINSVPSRKFSGKINHMTTHWTVGYKPSLLHISGNRPKFPNQGSKEMKLFLCPISQTMVNLRGIYILLGLVRQHLGCSFISKNLWAATQKNIRPILIEMPEPLREKLRYQDWEWVRRKLLRDKRFVSSGP